MQGDDPYLGEREEASGIIAALLERPVTEIANRSELGAVGFQDLQQIMLNIQRIFGQILAKNLLRLCDARSHQSASGYRRARNQSARRCSRI